MRMDHFIHIHFALHYAAPRPCSKDTWRAELIILYVAKSLINYSLFFVPILTSTLFLNTCYLNTSPKIENIGCITPYKKVTKY